MLATNQVGCLKNKSDFILLRSIYMLKLLGWIIVAHLKLNDLFFTVFEGFISWVDVSIGKIVSQYGTYKGSLDTMTVNPSNGVTHCGHANGTVTLWTPNAKKSVASVLCHGTPISAIAIDNVGRLVVLDWIFFCGMMDSDCLLIIYMYV